MKRYCKIIQILFFRDLFPAGEIKGFRRFFSYQLFISLLPSAGIFLLLSIVFYMGLCLLSVKQSIDKRLYELKTSPYMALFGEGFLYSKKIKTESIPHYQDIDKWRKIKIREIPSLPETYEQFGNELLFSSGVFPFSWVYLEFKNKEGEHLPYHGMGLSFSGEDSDDALIREIEKNLEKQKFRLDKVNEGIIISRRGMMDLKWEEGEEPSFLWVRLSEYDEEIPLPILDIVEILPHGFKYVISIKQYNLIKSSYYYNTLDSFRIGFVDENTQQVKDEIKKKLPSGATISGPFVKGKFNTFRVDLLEPWSRLKIIKNFLLINRENQKLLFGAPEQYNNSVGYNGGIFHLNPELMDSSNPDDNILLKIQELMENKDIKIKGGLIHAIQLLIHDQRSLKKIKNLYIIGLIATSLILTISFSIMLHTRIHRIGVIRMFGVSDFIILIIYLLEGAFLLLESFIFSVMLFYIKPILKFNFSLLTIETITLIGIIALFTMIGIIFPVLYFLWKLEPAEMTSYRD